MYIFRTIDVRATAEKVRRVCHDYPEIIALLNAGNVTEATKRANVTPVYHPRFRYQFIDYQGRKRTKTGTTSKSDTERLAERRQAFENEIRDGVRPAPKTSDVVRRFDDIAKEYRAWGERCGGRGGFGWSGMHAYNVGKRLTWWQTELKLLTLNDIHLASVEKALARLGASDLTPKTVQSYAETIASFCDWCVDRQYLDHDPLAGIKKLNTTPETPHRALTDTEIASLLKTAPANRALWYRVALATGYRQGELRALRVRNLDLFGPSLPLAAAFCKNRRDARQPISRELADELKALCEGKAQDAPLLDMPGKRVTGQHAASDIVNAGIMREIKGVGKATFHSLRVCYINAVVESGADLKTIMELARHSSATMSMATYAKPNAQRMRKAAEDAAEKLLNPAASTTVAERVCVGAENTHVMPDEQGLCVVSADEISAGSNPRDGFLFIGKSLPRPVNCYPRCYPMAERSDTGADRLCSFEVARRSAAGQQQRNMPAAWGLADVKSTIAAPSAVGEGVFRSSRILLHDRGVVSL